MGGRRSPRVNGGLVALLSFVATFTIGGTLAAPAGVAPEGVVLSPKVGDFSPAIDAAEGRTPSAAEPTGRTISSINA